VVLLSYNSEGFVPVEELVEEGGRLGEVTVFDEEYNTFRGCRNLRERAAHVTEHLIMIERA
jgi:adenine-specific DNA-methyltransferase